MEKVTNNVHKFRANAKETQEELAESVGVTRQTIIAIEKGNYAPSVLLALKIAKHFKSSADDIFRLTRGT